MSEESDFYRVLSAIDELHHELRRITSRCGPCLIEIKVTDATLDAIKYRARSAAPFPESAGNIDMDAVDLRGIRFTTAKGES